MDNYYAMRDDALEVLRHKRYWTHRRYLDACSDGNLKEAKRALNEIEELNNMISEARADYLGSTVQ